MRISTTHTSLRSRRGFAAALALACTMLACTMAVASPASAHGPARLRFGISGVGGGFVGAAHGGFGGVSPRLGVQLNDTFAVYVQGDGLVGRFIPRPEDGLAGFAFHTLMFEVTLADAVQLGIGPALDFVWGCTDQYQHACVGSGPYFGGDARIAFLLGNRGPGRRSGIAFSLDVHPTWFGEDASIALLLGIGFELY